MPLTDDLARLKDRTLADLDAAHDYHSHAKFAWLSVKLRSQAAAPGGVFLRGAATGNPITAAEFALKVEEYVAVQLAEATFQQFLAIFEHFLFDLFRLWLTAHPQSLGSRKLDFREVLDAPDKDAVTAAVVGRELNEVLYRRPAEWFVYINDKVNLGVPTADQVERLTEAKATRDVLAHNRGIANDVYVRKSGRLCRHKAGERIDIPEPYHRATWELVRLLADDLATAATAKAV